MEAVQPALTPTADPMAPGCPSAPLGGSPPALPPQFDCLQDKGGCVYICKEETDCTVGGGGGGTVRTTKATGSVPSGLRGGAPGLEAVGGCGMGEGLLPADSISASELGILHSSSDSQGRLQAAG